MLHSNIHRYAENMMRWAQAEPSVRALFWYGGYGYRRIYPNSDLDVALLLDGTRNISSVAEALIEEFKDIGESVVYNIADPIGKRITLWVGDSITKIDIVVGCRPDDLLWLADADDVPEPRLTLAYPVDDPEIDLLVARARKPIDMQGIENRRTRAELEIEKFLSAFEACSAAHAKSDAFEFYFQYNLALGRLARLIQLTRGGYRYLYQPRDLLSGLMSLEEQKQFRSLAGTLYLPEALELKRKLAKAFLDAVEEATLSIGVRTPKDDLANFLSRIQQRDLFFNIRDFSTYFQGLVRPGVLFRSSALSRWRDRQELSEWLQGKNIQDIIDFRNDEEVTKMPYAESQLRGRNYHRFPISGVGEGQDQSRERAYFEQMMAHPEAVHQAISAIANARGAVVVHCHVGRDRTGWFCAFLQSLLRLPKDDILQDYVASRSDVQQSYIIDLLDKLEANGGAVKMAEIFGISQLEITALRERFLMSEGASNESV